MFEVYRVEDRSNPDGVDFWDFLTEEEGESFITDVFNFKREGITIRPLTDAEVIDTALVIYKDSIKERYA